MKETIFSPLFFRYLYISLKIRRMKENIWKSIAELKTPGFFITADIICEDKDFPATMEAFIQDKLIRFKQGTTGRKYTFLEGGWRIHLTFFPTDKVVDERYALKNKMIKLGKHKN